MCSRGFLGACVFLCARRLRTLTLTWPLGLFSTRLRRLFRTLATRARHNTTHKLKIDFSIVEINTSHLNTDRIAKLVSLAGMFAD
jgi:hypothetical protein